MKKVLFLGFSVTEQRWSYAYELKDRWENSGFAHVSIVALGGFQPSSALHYLEEVLARDFYDTVVLEVSTSNWRIGSNRPISFGWPLRYLVESVLRAGAKPVFLCLPRTGIDYSADLATDVTREVANEYGVPLLQLDVEMAGNGVLEKMHPDGIHPTPEGAKWTANRIEDELKALIASERPSFKNEYFFQPNTFWVEKLLPSTAPDDYRIDRGGYPSNCASITPNKVRYFDVGREITVFGIMIGHCPTGSKITMIADGGISWTALAYDEFCYYQRITVRQTPEFTARTFAFTVSRDLPDVKLAKGEPSQDDRCVPVLGLNARNMDAFKPAFMRLQRQRYK
ncbi:SGNH/GDSL hydrolase family protein [Paraburkholderia sp. ZP32-5]|uniref:SGNH/GDSL hydrolase family protein n=1 Tax=Paraburkholderia sp. ZP32-5 TaxID=2883245 RepID=UPI001F3AC90C|nr:hypothetical protein [Paraburkholderia sp. ZP32-5]